MEVSGPFPGDNFVRDSGDVFISTMRSDSFNRHLNSGLFLAGPLFPYISISNNDKWMVMMTTTEKVVVVLAGGCVRIYTGPFLSSLLGCLACLPFIYDPQRNSNGRKITNRNRTIEWNGGHD